MGKRLTDKLVIDYYFRDIDDSGTCFAIDADTYPRHFEIEIKSGLGRLDILSVIAHELVHVKQFARRELIQPGLKVAKYLGKEYQTEDLNYWDLPWEIEALGREIGLFTRYDEHLQADPHLTLRLTR